MTRLSRLKLAVAAVGVGVWALGARLGDDRLTWAGIVCLALAFLLRFLNPRREQNDEQKEEPQDRS